MADTRASSADRIVAGAVRRNFFMRLLPLLLLFLLCVGCAEGEGKRTLTLWHQLTPADRALLERRVDDFEAWDPNISVRVLYKETEELRSGFQAAALAGIGPELVHGATDVLGPFHAMGIIQDLSDWLPPEKRDRFLPNSLTYIESNAGDAHRELAQIPDRFGNHLALIYNKDFVVQPPKTVEELLAVAKANTLDEDGDGRRERYGLVWNFVEPFFAIPFVTGYGGWVFDESGEPIPQLNTPEHVAAYEFILSLRDSHRVVPRNCDYETADSLFKSGKAAMIINGDWSWADYLAAEGIDASVAPLPTIDATGKPMTPMISPKGYSLNVNVTGQAAADAKRFVEYMTSEESQRFFMDKGLILPSLKALYDEPQMEEHPVLQASRQQLENGRLMPVAVEMRAVWDAMRPPYQSLLGGNVTAEEAAEDMQREAERAIALMNRTSLGKSSAWVWQLLGTFLCGGLLWWQRHSLLQLLPDMRRQPLAYCMVVPSILVICLTVAFPFLYNVLLSLSNMSLTNFREWEIIGLENFGEVFAEGSFYWLLLKTLFWTLINVFFHTFIGVLLALALNGPIRGKTLYRICLIIPWAVPAYITALTWRSMFHYDYGAVNALANSWPLTWITQNSLVTELIGAPPYNWLGEPSLAFTACIVANVWLGYPFMMVIALGGLQGIPTELYEAARIDGANRLRQFIHVTLPLLKPVLAPAVTLGAIWTFNNLNIVWLVSNGGEPSDETHILVSYVYKAVFNLYRYGYGAALSMVIFAILLAASLLGLMRTKATESVYT